MTLFRAWHLPAGFSLKDQEVTVRRRGQSTGGPGQGRPREEWGEPAFQHPTLTEARMKELMALLRQERERSLLPLPVGRIVDAVDRVARRLLDEGDSLRSEAIAGVAFFTGYSTAMAQAVVDGMARGWTAENLWTLIRSEFRFPGALDGFVPGAPGRQVRAMGFPLAFHLGAGTVPGVATTSMIRSLLVKSGVLLKPGLGDVALPVLFARGLEEADPELGRCVATLYWPGEERDSTRSALMGVDLVAAYGSDETVTWVRRNLPAHTVFRAYRHRMGFVLIGRGVMTRGASEDEVGNASAAAEETARAVAMFDQQGCVSPHAVLVERGGEISPEEWTRLLAESLRGLESVLPSGEVSREAWIDIQQRRGAAEVQEGSGRGSILHGGEEAPWTVRFDGEGRIEPSCLNRSVTVLPVETLDEAVKALAPWASYLQTVGLATGEVDGSRVLEGLARLGVSRIVPLYQVPWPKPWWHHDGSGPLQDLVRWTDVELG